MEKSRLVAFSDGVIAIILTIMVLEMKAPHSSDLKALEPILPVFMSYILSYIYIAIYWNNHHHMMHAVEKVNGKILWLNIHLLFWLSILPFVTAWMGENHFTQWPIVFYGVVLTLSATAYFLLARELRIHHGEDSTLANAIGSDNKGKISIVLYSAGIGLTFIQPWLGFAMYVVVASMWLIPDRRIEKKIVEEEKEKPEGRDE